MCFGFHLGLLLTQFNHIFYCISWSEFLLSPCCRCGECDEQHCFSSLNSGDWETGGLNREPLWEAGEVPWGRTAFPSYAAVSLQCALDFSLSVDAIKNVHGVAPYITLWLLFCLFFLLSLSNLFHGMDENTPVRYTVYCSLIKVAATCNAIAFIPTELDQVCWFSSYTF